MKSTYAPSRFETPQRRATVDFGRKKAACRISEFLAPITREAARSDYLVFSPTGAFAVQRAKYRIARYIGLGPASGDMPLKFAIFAGWRGDEGKSSAALIAFLRRINTAPRRMHGAQIYAYPIANPLEFEQGAAGERDLVNALWRGSAWPEAYFLERELGTHQFRSVVALRLGAHPRLTARTESALLQAHVVAPALKAANRDFSGSLASPPNRATIVLPPPFLTQELETFPAPFELIVSLPSTSEIDALDRAVSTFLEHVLSGYRAFVSTHHHI